MKKTFTPKNIVENKGKYLVCCKNILKSSTIAFYANYLQKKIASHKAAYEERLMGGCAAESNNNDVPKSPPSIS